ncbi:hypothetical protein [Roseobacter ponti]|uniref:Uncharacterized protein n=1 Tax=Roseobacter ponti TaxID=1891787 RepID=A0A858ST63_9RHOB|nr:hypothetical protein [Roseobacter ponti]QJF51520.1 hypothetical protein G3256_10275 [Roseobacter ponti]
MSVTLSSVNFQTIAPQPVRAVDGGRMIIRSLMGLAGAALMMTAVGLWIAPGASWSHDLILMKLLLSAVSGMAGIAMLQGVVRPGAPKVEIDTIRHEIRLVRMQGRDRWVLDRCAFADLTRVENSGTHVQLWGKNETLLAEVAAADRVAHRSLVTALRVAGKL